jgi:hypothetical protein
MARKAGQKGLTVLMSEGELTAVHGLARNRGFKITADYVRALIEADAVTQQVALKFEVDRGGNRRVIDDEGNEAEE